jgi:hypothetical protein
MTTTKTQPEPKKTIQPVIETQTGGILLPSSSDEKILEAFKRYQGLKVSLLLEDDYTHFVKWVLGEGKPSTKGFAFVADADKFTADQKEKGFSVTQERRIKKSGVLKLGKAFAVSTEVVSESILPTGAVYRVRASAPNGQFAERVGSCDKTEKGHSPFDHILAIALTRACNRASMALLGGESTAEEFVDDDALAEAKPVKSTVVETKVVATTNPAVTAVVETEKRPEQKTEAEIKADLDKAFQAKAAAKPATERNELLKRLFNASRKAGQTDAQLRLQMHKAYKVESTKDLSLVDLEGFARGIEELARINTGE